MVNYFIIISHNQPKLRDNQSTLNWEYNIHYNIRLKMCFTVVSDLKYLCLDPTGKTQGTGSSTVTVTLCTADFLSEPDN